MTTTTTTLIEGKTAEASQTTQYTSNNVITVIDKFTATNYSATAQTISVNLVVNGGVAGDDNLVVKQRRLQASETYTFPELTGHVLLIGGFISTLASAGASINIRASGRNIS